MDVSVHFGFIVPVGMEILIKSYPIGRIGEPEDIANAVAFLASPESGWITAQLLTVDGGRMDYIGHG